jgi:hypothetical protein
MAKGLLNFPLRKVVSAGTYWNRQQKRDRNVYRLECGHVLHLLEGKPLCYSGHPKRMRCDQCPPKEPTS